MRSFLLIPVAVVVASFGAACSSSSPSTSSGLSGSTLLVSLTPSEQGSLCDSVAASEGGYGHTTMLKCDGGASLSYQVPANQAACVAKFNFASTCTATVSDLEACAAALSHPSCAETGQGTACAPLAASGCTPK